MPYRMGTRRWADTEPVVLFSEDARGGSASQAVELGDRGVVRLTLSVKRIQGAGKLTVRVETAETELGPWRGLGAFEPKSAPGDDRRSFAGLDRWVRAACEVDTDARFVFSLAGEAV